MNQLIIHLPLEDYVSNDFGKFSVQLGDYYFPSKVWTDFGQTVVFDWMKQLTKLFSEPRKKVSWKFMDGNYRLDLATTNSKEILNLSFIKEKRDSDEIEHQENANINQLSEEILKAIKTIQDDCRKNSNQKAVERIEITIQKFLGAKDNFLK